MRWASSSLLHSMRAVSMGLQAPAFYALLLASMFVWALAYQVKQEYTVDVGGQHDDAYVTGFNAKERNPQLNYRWTGRVSSVEFPGIGSMPVELTIRSHGIRLAGEPSPRIRIEAGGQSFDLQTQPVPHSDTFFVPRSLSPDGGLTVRVISPVFTPPGDPRTLGVIIDTVAVRPVGSGLRPFTVPSLGVLASALFALVCVYCGMLVSFRRSAPALLLVGGVAMALAALIVFSRPELGLLARTLPALGISAATACFAGRTVLDTALGPDLPTGGHSFAAAAGSAAFALALLLRLGGTLYPQFLSSDLFLHVHNLQSVLRGEWLFTEPLPDGTPVPYPVAYYVLLAPLGALAGGSDAALATLLKLSASLFDSLACLALALLGVRIGASRAGGYAALLYALSHAPFVLLSAGNYTNLFAQSIFNLTLLGALLLLVSKHARIGVEVWAAIGVGFFLTVLGHYGMMLAAMTVLGLYAVWTLYVVITKRSIPAEAYLLASFAAALVAGFGLYYVHFTGEMASQWGGVFARLGGARSPGTQARADDRFFPAELARKAAQWMGALPVINSLFGGYRPGAMSPPALALLACWLLASLVFAVLDQALGSAVRWYYMAAAPVSLLAGVLTARLAARGRWGRALVAIELSAALLFLLNYWVGELIFTRYH